MKQYNRFWQGLKGRKTPRVFVPAFKHILSCILLLQLAVGPAVAMAGQAATSTGSVVPGYLASLAEQDSILDQFINSPRFTASLSVSTQDPALDRDPFFLRSQQWIDDGKFSDATSALATGYSYRVNAGGVDISVDGTGRVLHLNLPVTPIHQTENFVFFSLNQGSPLFANASGPLAADENVGEGLFFINVQELPVRALQNQPVPVFFLPLPGNGWTGTVDAIEFHQLNLLAVQNSAGLTLPLDLNDVTNVMKVEAINLMMASLLTVHPGSRPDLPPPGSTNGFGMFFTGLDLAHPGNSLWEISKNNSLELKNQLRKIWRFIDPIQEANAFDIPPDLIHKVAYVGTILGSTLIASFVAKMSIFKEEFKKRHADQSDTLLNHAKNGVTDTLTVFAESLKTIGQMPAVTFANALENFTDRLMPTITAGDHTLVRRFMNRTIYWSRNTLRQVATNWWTFYLGALVFGTVDTASVVIQYLWFIPAMCGAVAPMLSQWWQNRIDTTFSPSNAATSSLVLNDSVRNMLAWVQRGASQYAEKTQAQFSSQFQAEVDDELRKTGKNPLAPENQSVREAMVRDKMNTALKQRGLPDKKESLYDAATINGMLPQALGYRNTDEQLAGHTYILETRWGLTSRALDRAIEAAEAQAQGKSESTYMEVVEILRDTRAQLSFFKNGLLEGRTGIQRARDVRRMLTLLSYQGPIDTVVENVPEIWEKKYSPLAAKGASILFRKALFSYLSKEGPELLMPSREATNKFAQTAETVALDKLKEAYRAESLQEIKQKHSYELELEKHQAMRNMAQAEIEKIEASGYKPPKKGWIVRWQEARAARQADQAIQIQMAKTSADRVNPPSQKDYSEQWTKLYTLALARVVGLHVEPNENKELLTYIEQKAESLTQSQIANEPGLGDYMKSIIDYERMKLEASLYAVNYLRQYKIAATDMELVPALSTAQPGRFQKIRQTIFRNSKIGTRITRFFESWVSDQSFDLGLKGVLNRNVPFHEDMVSALGQMTRGLPMALSVSYLFNYYFWQVHLSFGTWMLFQLTTPLIIVPDQWLSRMFRQQGLKPMDTTWSKLKYAMPYAWMTFFGSIPLMLFAPDMQALFQDYIRDPIMNVVNQVPTAAYAGAAAAVPLAATSKVRQFFKNLFMSGKNENANVDLRPSLAPSCEAMFEQIPTKPSGF